MAMSLVAHVSSDDLLCELLRLCMQRWRYLTMDLGLLHVLPKSIPLLYVESVVMHGYYIYYIVVDYFSHVYAVTQIGSSL